MYFYRGVACKYFGAYAARTHVVHVECFWQVSNVEASAHCLNPSATLGYTLKKKNMLNLSLVMNSRRANGHSCSYSEAAGHGRHEQHHHSQADGSHYGTVEAVHHTTPYPCCSSTGGEPTTVQGSRC